MPKGIQLPLGSAMAVNSLTKGDNPWQIHAYFNLDTVTKEI